MGRDDLKLILGEEFCFISRFSFTLIGSWNPRGGFRPRYSFNRLFELYTPCAGEVD